MIILNSALLVQEPQFEKKPGGPHVYYVLNKPYHMVSQFVSPHDVPLLADLPFSFPEGIHAIGRLDINSEGLLLLTTDKTITRKLFDPEKKHQRKYLVQINREISAGNLHRLQTGVDIRVEGGGYYRTPACAVSLVEDPATIYPQIDDTSALGPHTWLLITLYEGKYRQVRKMIGAIHHRCKRLIRVSIEDLSLGDILPGEIMQMEQKEFFEKLHLSGDL